MPLLEQLQGRTPETDALARHNSGNPLALYLSPNRSRNGYALQPGVSTPVADHRALNTYCSIVCRSVGCFECRSRGFSWEK